MMKIAESTITTQHVDLNSLGQAEFYRLLVDSIQDYAIFLMDTDGLITSWNKGAQRLKGYKPEEIIGRHFSSFYPEEDIRNRKPQKELEFCNKFGRVEDEGWRVCKDGTRFWANVIITALKDGNGKLIGYAKVTRDLTNRKRQEDELKLANRQLSQQRRELEILNQSKDEFISLASHQLRTPASGVKQFLGLLLEGYAGELTEQQIEFAQRAYESNDRQIELVNDLLRVAQVDAGQVKLVKRKVNLCELIKAVVEEQRDSFRARKQKLSLHLPDTQLKATVDEMRFRMALENLIDNASKYTPEKGTISVSVKKNKKNNITIDIVDNGVGIDEESLTKLFVKFTRIPNALSESVGGSGLGLYWAKKIVELHDGSINVVSHPGKGSVFTITIPAEGKHD